MSKEQEQPDEPASVFMPSTRQIAGYRFFTAVLIDLVVLNLFAEYWERVELLSFTVSLFAAILLQLSLRATFKVEHYFASFFTGKSGFV